jgi:AraC-like DNA-binding protein
VNSELRTVESRYRLGIEFNCEPGGGEVKRTERLRGEAILVEQFQASVVRTVLGYLDLPAEMQCLVFLKTGTTLVRAESERRWLVIPSHSVVFLRGPMRLILNVARGEHLYDVVTWPEALTPFINRWLMRRGPGDQAERRRMVASKPVDPYFRPVLERFEEALEGSGDMAEPLILSVLYQSVPNIIMGGDQMRLAPLPAELPPSIQGLVEQVKTNPDTPWPLKEAAATAGYSPFHFSRVFKQLVGYGFHEFVDRCRTELAIEMLCNSVTSIDAIASTCGFGTTQGLRESVKEYLGLVPSELRNLPDEGAGDSKLA